MYAMGRCCCVFSKTVFLTMFVYERMGRNEGTRSNYLWLAVGLFV